MHQTPSLSVSLLYMGIMLIAALFLWLTLHSLMVMKKNWFFRLLVLSGCYLLSCMIIYIGDWDNLPPTLLFFFACLWFGCEGSRLKRATLALMLASAVFAFNSFLDNCLSDWIGVHVFLRALLCLGYSALLYLGVKSRRPEHDFELSAPFWKLMLALTLIPFAIVVSLILLRSPDYLRGGSTYLADTALFLTTAFSFAILSSVLPVLERQQRLEQEALLSRHNRQYYEAMEAQQFEIRRLRHDLANHLAALLSLPDEKRTSYIQELLASPSFSQTLRYSGDATVNAVLTAKAGLFSQKGIPFEIRVEIPEELPFDKAQLCALLANALDNAAEACEKLPASKRQVTLCAKAAKGMLALSVKNPYPPDSSAPEAGGGRSGAVRLSKENAVSCIFPKTTKKDPDRHGLGLKSIHQVVKQYGGTMEIRREDGWFELFCWLPLTT